MGIPERETKDELKRRTNKKKKKKCLKRKEKGKENLTLSNSLPLSSSSFLNSIKKIFVILSYELCPLSQKTRKEFISDFAKKRYYYSKIVIDLLHRFLFSFPCFLWKSLVSFFSDKNGIYQKLSWQRKFLILSWISGQVYCTYCKYELGVIFFCASILVLIFTVGLDYREIEEGEMSAYSVFNKGCSRLLGTYNIEEWERLIRHNLPDEPIDEDE